MTAANCSDITLVAMLITGPKNSAQRQFHTPLVEAQGLHIMNVSQISMSCYTRVNDPFGLKRDISLLSGQQSLAGHFTAAIIWNQPVNVIH